MPFSASTYALAKKYTDKTVEGLGAIKGANCVVKETKTVDGGTEVTFEWTGTSGTKETTTILVKNGEQGNGIAKIEKIKTVDFVDTYRMTFDDGSTFDYEVVNGGGSTGESQIVFSKLANFPAVGESDKVYIDTDTSKSYIFTNNNYQLVGDGGNVAWSKLT